MIIFKCVRWKNLLSYGNTFTEIALNEHQSTMISGENGSGKSSMLTALTFCLFGRSDRRVNKSQLINTKNGKRLLTEVEFSVGEDEYMIRRGQKPEVFEIHKNGHVLKQDGKRGDFQAFLENSILHMDFATFTQLVIIGRATHTPFMALPAQGRRNFIEMILNLTVFSQMNKIHAANMVALKEKIDDVKSAIQVSTEKIKVRKKYLADLEETDKQHTKNNKNFFDSQISALRDEIKAAQEAINGLQSVSIAKGVGDHLETLKNDLNQRKKSSAKLDGILSVKKSAMRSLLSKDLCTECGQVISAERKKEHLTQIKTEIETLAEQISMSNAANTIAEKEIAELETLFSKKQEYDNAVLALKRKIQETNTRIKQIEEEKKSIAVSLHTEKIADEKKTLVKMIDVNGKLIAKLDEHSNKMEYFVLMSTMLKDSGIRASVIKRFIPIINAAINNNLGKLGFFAKFTLDENFVETIQSRGIDSLSYFNFSEGEKLRIDMAILLAWRDIAKLQNKSHTNLLVFDEMMDASLDIAGTEALFTLLLELRNTNLFIVTHTPAGIRDKVTNTIEFEKMAGFSRIVA